LQTKTYINFAKLPQTVAERVPKNLVGWVDSQPGHIENVKTETPNARFGDDPATLKRDLFFITKASCLTAAHPQRLKCSSYVQEFLLELIIYTLYEHLG